jgi:shikimate dehydrogenase
MKKPPPTIYALFGNPIEQSLSPLMHNAAYKQMRLNALYVAFCVEDLAEAIRGIKGFAIQGASVTIPFKTAVMRYLNKVEESVHTIGAVNTIVHDDNGMLAGYNTDWIGLVRGLEESLEIRDKTFVILGAGGTARAAVFGILQRGGSPLIVNRTIAKGEDMAREFGCPCRPLSEIGEIRADCLINTTPVGMGPERDRSPIEKEALGNFRWVMDCIYNPLKTRLLKDAEEAGCTAINGLGMFVHQGAEQIKIWTGMDPPREFMKQVALEKLRGEDGD